MILIQHECSPCTDGHANSQRAAQASHSGHSYIKKCERKCMFLGMADNKYKHKLYFSNLKGRWITWPKRDQLLYENSWYGIRNLILNIKGLRKQARETNVRGCLFSLNNPTDNQICSWSSFCLNSYANPHPWLGCRWIMNLGNQAE